MATTPPSPIRPSGFALLLIIGAAWLYLAYMAWGMANMDQAASLMLMPAMQHWTALDLALVFIMWMVMMAGMMLPSAIPMVRIFDRCRGVRGAPHTGLFVSGYLAVWSGFSLLATLAQWGLLELRLVTPMMQSASYWFSGGLLIGAGLFQFTRFKDRCLTHCRSPLGFMISEWRPGASGAFLMGVRHGLFCAGCCAMLMLLLFVLGVMNLIWILVLTLIVLTEKLPVFERFPTTRILGAGLILWGGIVLAIAQA